MLSPKRDCHWLRVHCNSCWKISQETGLPKSSPATPPGHRVGFWKEEWKKRINGRMRTEAMIQLTRRRSGLDTISFLNMPRIVRPSISSRND